MSRPRRYRPCAHCGEQLPLTARSDARYCSARCRVAAMRARRRIPAELRRRDRWVRHDAAKVPLTADGRPASSTDPSTWTSHDRACRSAAGAGLGWVLSRDDDVVCIDLDHCLTADGRPVEWAAALLEGAPPTYIEVSPSGDGLHIWGRADFAGGRRLRRGGGGVEIYGSGRYITVTGRRYGRSPVELGRLDDLIASLV